MEKVQLDKRLLLGLLALTLAALLTAAFLLGREFGPSVKLLPPTKAQASVTGPRSAEVPPSSAASLPMPPPLQLSGKEPAQAVAAYFNAVDHLQPEELNGGPEGTAQGVLASLMKGDSSSFDALIQQAESTHARLTALAPPPPCAAYHHDCLANLEEGLALMHAMKAALTGQPDQAQIAELSSRATALKARSESLEQEEQALRQRFNLPPKP